jgi:4-amino-4-deoxy-L-arabinose transferase-like glycosyltransferase
VPRPGRRRSFATILLLILGVALVVRVAFVVFVARDDHHFYDAAYYELQARAIADGRGYTDPFQYLPGHPQRAVPSAQHPPLTVLALVPPAWIGNELGVADTTSRMAMRFEIALVGLLGVAMIGLLGREVAGDRTGLVAAGLAAVYPYLWVNDGLIMSEAFAVVLVTVAMILTLRIARGPTLWKGLALGVVCGLAALARAELVLLAPLLGLPLLWAFRDAPWSRRLGVVALVGVGTVAVLAPWVAYNLSRFQDPTFVSTNDGIAMLASNCRQVYGGPAIGFTDLNNCLPKSAPKGDDTVATSVYRRRATRYMEDHKSRLVLVELARIGRDWGVFRPNDMLAINVNEGRPRWVTGLGMVFYYPMLVLGIAGIVVLRRRKIRQWPLLMPPLVVTLATVVSFGNIRFRVPAEPSLVVLASVAAVAIVAHWWPEEEPGEPQRDSEPAPSSAIEASSSS